MHHSLQKDQTLNFPDFREGVGANAKGHGDQLKLPVVPLTEQIKADIDPKKAHIDYQQIPIPSFASQLDKNKIDTREGKTKEPPHSKDKSLTDLRQILSLSKRFLKDLWAVSPQLAISRGITTVATSASTIFSLYAGGRAVKELIDASGGNGVVTEGLLFWGGLTIAGGLVSLFCSKRQQLVGKMHDLRIGFENYRQILSTISSIPPYLSERKEISSNITQVRRTEWKINALCQSSFSLAQSSASTMIAAGAFIAAPQPIGALIGTGCLLLPGILSIYSYNRQAERADTDAKNRTEAEKHNNFNRVTLMSPNGIRDLAMRLKNGAFVRKVLENFGQIQKSQENVVAKNNKDQTVTEFTGHIATHVGWTGLALGVVSGSLDMAQFTFLASTLWHARRQLDVMCNDLGRVGEHLRFMKPLYELEDLVKKEQESREHILFNESPDVVMKELVFRYPNSDRIVLEIPYLKIKAGTRVAVVGENGAGKSTFIKLLSGVYLPPEGEVLIGGYTTKDFIPHFSMIAQDREDFKGSTIREDICMNLVGDEGIPLSEEAREVIYEITSKKSRGLDTRKHPTFDDGEGLSGGQEQLIALVGSLVSPARIKVRDEAFSQLSPPNEIRLTRIIEKEKGPCTLIDVTHRLAAAASADTILVFENGRISHQGNHKELMQTPGWYQEHFLEQQKAYKA
jgi:ABC-type bacteriocin/lantibiotic exporter with double-glycine peptidase domain